MPDPRPQLRFRRLVHDDLPTLASWLGQPHVARFWRESSALADVTARYTPCIDGDDPTRLYVVTADGRDIGMFQRYRIAANPDWLRALQPAGVEGIETAAGIDYLIGIPELVHRGIGTTAISQFSAETLTAYPDVDRIVVTVDIDNRASWRALERASYVRRWTGEIVSGDPSDAGTSHLYELPRVSESP